MNDNYSKVDQSIYQYVHDATSALGDYPYYQYQRVDHFRSEFFEDVDSSAVYFAEELGLKKGDVAALFMESTPEQLIALFALNRLGITALLLNHLTPIHRVQEMVTTVAAKKLFTSRPCELESTIFDLEEARRYRGKSVPEVEVSGKDIGILFGSGGTTGKSKIVRIPNSAINNVLLAAMKVDSKATEVEVGVDSQIACMPFYHSYGLCPGAISALLVGRKLIVLPKFDASEYLELMRLNRVTHMQGVPTLYKKLMENPAWDGEYLASVRQITSGGDSVDGALVEKMRKSVHAYNPQAVFSRGYGLTECCGAVTKCTSENYREHSIGQPLKGLKVEIWDEENRRVPNGTTGEVVVSGPTIMAGYWNSDGVENDGIHFDEEGTRWVKTGDLAYVDDDGFFFFRGRKKRVIIISGYNVYPGDIEEAVFSLGGIKESCAVKGYQDGHKIVRLYLVKADESIDEEELKAKISKVCAENISRFAVPRDFRFISALPRTQLNKVDFMRLTQEHPGSSIYTTEEK